MSLNFQGVPAARRGCKAPVARANCPGQLGTRGQGGVTAAPARHGGDGSHSALLLLGSRLGLEKDARVLSDWARIRAGTSHANRERLDRPGPQTSPGETRDLALCCPCRVCFAALEAEGCKVQP